MKYVLTLFTICISFSVFSQKVHPEQKVIEQTARKFIKALVYEKYDDAKALSTDGTKTMIEQLKMFASMVPDSLMAEMAAHRKEAQSVIYVLKKIEFEENNAFGCFATFQESDNPRNKEIIYLVKQNGVWLVDLEGLLPNN